MTGLVEKRPALGLDPVEASTQPRQKKQRDRCSPFDVRVASECSSMSVCLFVWCFLTSSFGLWMDWHPAGTLLRVDHHLVDEMMKHAAWNHYKERLLTAGATDIVHGSL